jgi:hypothetical protein
MLPHRNIHKLAWVSPDEKTHDQIDHILIGDGSQVFLMSDYSGEQIVSPLSDGGKSYGKTGSE